MNELYEKVYSNPDIYKIYVPLPKNPLKNLNSYVIKTPERNLIIDTGFNLKDCRDALLNGLFKLNVDMENTDIFITHLHSDHLGLASCITSKNTKIYISKTDYKYFIESRGKEYWEKLNSVFILNGFPENIARELNDTNPARAFASDEIFDAVTVCDNYKFNIGCFEARCISTPGHSPDHMCLYLEKEKLLFSGDHVLFDITPNITCWNGIHDALGNYIESLKKIKEYDIRTALPGHRGNEKEFYKRVDELISHHETRLLNILDILSEKDGQSTYEIASKMKWSIRAKSFDDFPNPQKWFAMGEALSHMDYLEVRGKVSKEKNKEGIYLYYGLGL